MVAEAYDIPFEMSAPRISANLSFFGQGPGGGPLGEEGFANFDSKTNRIDNDGGSWEGEGVYFWVNDGEGDQVDIETVLLTGAWDYEGQGGYDPTSPTIPGDLEATRWWPIDARGRIAGSGRR